MNNRMHLAPIGEDILAASDEADNSGIAEDMAKKLADEIPADTTAITGDKVALERVLEKRRAHKRELQKLLSETKAKVRQITETIRGIEDHIDRLAESEA